MRKTITLATFSLIMLFSTTLMAASGSCTITTKNTTSFTVPTISSDRITAGLSGNMGTYRILYTWSSYRTPIARGTCTSSTPISYDTYRYMITSYGDPIFSNNEWIYPTNVSGIGISFYSFATSLSIGTADNPTINIDNYTGTSVSLNPYALIQIRLWKIPGINGTADSDGSLNFDGFTFIEVVRPRNYPSDKISNIPAEDQSNALAGSVTMNSIAISGKISLVPGTCSLDDKNIEMGTHHHSPAKNTTPWVNANFTINCPEAWGYGRTATMSGTSENTVTSRSTNNDNTGIIVTVYPYNSIVDNNRGIMEVNKNGSSGYDIQLAWGDSATLPTTADPSVPVIYGQPQIISTNNFGHAGATTSQEVKMSARYIRNSKNVEPGRADASVEIVASYN